MNFIDEQLLQLKHSDPNFVAPNLQDNTYTDNGNWLEAAGIGASHMLNNLGLGGVAQALGNLGAGVEYISPFSGSRDSDRARLESWGVPPEIARQAYPDEDSWLTSGAKGLLEAQNFIADKIKAWRDEAIGDNPSYGTNVAEGVGSSLGFMGAGVLGTLASGGNPLIGAIISGATEALSESGGTLGDAYRQGLYDNGGLAAANKSFLSNAALNSGLNLMGGMFSPWMSNIRNPLTRYAAQTAGEVLNELVQEPSQQVIEKSALDSLGNGGNFTSALGQNIPEWWDTAKQLAPTVSASSLITSLLKTGYDMSSAQNRQIVRDQWRNRMYDPQETADSLKSELDARQRLLNQLQREKNTVNDEAKIAAINDSIAKAERRIAMYQDRLKPGNLDYTPNPYDEFSGKVSPVSTIAGQNTYNTAFKLMEADDITTSHKDDFSVNPNFPQERQIRNRSNSVSQQEVERIAATLDPNALGDNYLAQNGAPIIAEDNSDLSGNGRVLAIRRAYSHHPEQAKKYRQFIIDNAANFGVDPDLAARMEKPVLVRVLLGDNDLAKFATEANSNTIQQLSAGEQAIKDLDIINKSGIMQKFDPLKPLAQQTEVLKDFAAGLQPNERNNFFTDAGQGGISNSGLQRVQDAISAYAYGNSEIIGKLSEAASDISRNVSNALKSLAGRFAHLKATNRGHLDISNDIAQAIQHLDRFRRNKSKSVSEQAAQQNLSGNGQNIDEQLNLSPEAELLLRFFDQFGNQPNTILQGLANYAQLASSQAEDGQQTIDPDLNRDKLSILREALGDKTATVQQATQQTTPTTANSLPTATQAQQNTLNVTALNDTQQAQKAPQVTALGSNEAYYGDDYYSDRGGDNSNPEQDIPGNKPAVDITRANTQISRPGTTRANPIIGRPNVIRGTQGLEEILHPPAQATLTQQNAAQNDDQYTTEDFNAYRNGNHTVEQNQILRGRQEARFFLEKPTKNQRGRLVMFGSYGGVTPMPVLQGFAYELGLNPNNYSDYNTLYQAILGKTDELISQEAEKRRKTSEQSQQTQPQSVQQDSYLNDGILAFRFYPEGSKRKQDVRFTSEIKATRDGRKSIHLKNKTFGEYVYDADTGEISYRGDNPEGEKFLPTVKEQFERNRNSFFIQRDNNSNGLPVIEKGDIVLRGANSQVNIQDAFILRPGINGKFEVIYVRNNGEYKGSIQRIGSFEGQTFIPKKSIGYSKDLTAKIEDFIRRGLRRNLTVIPDGAKLKSGTIDISDMTPPFGSDITTAQIKTYSKIKVRAHPKSGFFTFHFNGDKSNQPSAFYYPDTDAFVEAEGNHSGLNTLLQQRFREKIKDFYSGGDISENPQGARLVENSQVNTSDEERKQAKSIPDYSDDTDPTNLRPVPLQQNRQPYNNIDTIGLNDWQYQDNSDFDTPLIADISDLQQEYANEQQTQKTLGNLPNLNDNQGRGNLGSDIGNRSQVTSQRKQADISSEQNNDDNSQFSVPQFADISDIRQSEMNNDENSYAAAIPLNNRLNSQHDDNIQSLPVQQNNNTPDSANVQNQQDSDYMKDYIDPEVIRTKDGDIHTQGAFVRRSYIPSEQAQIKNAAQTGKPMKRYVFVGRGENDTSAPTHNSPETYSYDARYSGQNGYIGDIQTGAGDNSAAAHAFYGTQDGVHYVGFADDNGNFVATYNMNDNSFFINEGSETSGLARRIEDDFRRQFGKNPTEEIIRRLVMQKAINAGENDTVADAASRIYIAMNENLASQTGISLLDMAMADNLMIQKVSGNGENNDRGSSNILSDTDSKGNMLLEAQSIMSLFQKSDVSTVPHEFWHIYQEKMKRIMNSGLKIDPRSNLWQDWQTIRSQAGLLQANFKEGLSPQEQAKWLNSQEKNAAMFEQYLRQGEAPKDISAKIRQVFKNFKDWLGNLYQKAKDIFYTNANGRRISQPFVSNPMRKVFDHIFAGDRKFNVNQSTQQAHKLSAYSDPQGFQEFRQSGLDPQGWFSQIWDKLKNWAGNLFHSAARIGLPKHATDWRSLPFPNQDIERKFMDAMKAAPKLGLIGRMRQAVRDIAASIKGGDYSDITNSPRKNDPQLRLNEALQAFRNLGRAKIAAADKAVSVMTNIIKPLNQKQRELLNTYTVIRDIMEQIQEMPGSALSFGLTEQDARNMNAKLSRMVDEDEQVRDAVKRLDDSRNAQVEEFKKQAHALGLNFDDVFHYKNYFRRRVIQYLDAARTGKRTPSARGNLDIQNRYDGELRAILGRDFFKKRKGTTLDYITDYVQANAEVRAQMAQDIETMKTLLYLKKHHDIAPSLRKQHGIKSQQLEIDYDGSQTFSQSGDEEQKTIHDVIPEGYEAFDPSATRLIETAQSAPENLLHMIANDIAEQHGVPLDDMLERLGIQNDGNIMVIPTEIANSLRKLAKSRHRGMLGQAAKDFTTWWKRSVLFTPTRNLLYNIRNFTGDLDALIAGNPKALRHLPQAIRELTGWFTHHGKEGYEASQDLQDYIRLSGSLGIQSLNLSAKDAQAILDFFPVPEKTKSGKTFPKRAEKEAARLARNTERAQTLQDEQEQDPGKLKKAWAKSMSAVGKFFQLEHSFTEWREHLLRYAAYLEYKQQMETNKDDKGHLTGRPSNWGASIEQEVMSISDIKERAFKMSNELLGAYDQVSEVGKQLRDMLIPFYSWMEVNMRRTYRLLKNGFKYGYGAQQVKRLGAGKLAAMPLYAVSALESFTRLAALTIAMQMFNRFVFPDADDDLPNDVKYRPHVTVGEINGRVYYFDRPGAFQDAVDWFGLDSAWLDAKDFANGQKSLGSWLKQIVQAPFSKVINGLNPAIKMPIELAMGRSMFPNAFNPSTIRDPAEYVARSFGLAWPYKAARGIPHSNAQEASKMVIYSQDTDEAAYWQTLDRVRQFQNEVLDKHFDGFASTRRGRILANIKKALRYNDGAAVRRFLREYNEADGTKQGLKASMKAMNPLHGLSEKEKKQFLRWISADDRKYLRKAERYFHQLADRFTR